MVDLPLLKSGNGLDPYRLQKDRPDGPYTSVSWEAFFSFEPEALLHPDGLRGIYGIRFIPEGFNSFVVYPEPDRLYTIQEAYSRVVRVCPSFSTGLYLEYRLFATPLNGRIGFK